MCHIHNAIPARGDALPERGNFMYPHLKPALKPIAALLPLLFVAPLHAADEKPDAIADAIIVTATRQPIRASEVLADVTVIDRAEIEKSGQDTIDELLARQPGVQLYTSGGAGTISGLFLRGANPNQTKVLVDGIAINNSNDGKSALQFLSLDSVERIEILRGPASSLYGSDAIGGVISIITRNGRQGLRADGFVGYGSHNTRRANAGISGGDEHWRFRVEANHYETDGFSASRHASNKDADNDAYRNTGGAASVSFLPAEGHEIGLIYRNNKGLVHYDSDSGYAHPASDYDYRQRFETEQWQIFSKNRILDNWESTLRYGEAEDDDKDYAWDRWASAESLTRTHTRNRQLSWQNDIALPLGKALLAVEKQKQDIGPRYDSTGSTLFSDHSPSVSNTSYLAGWTAHQDKHSWQLNARHDKHSRFGNKTTYSAAYGYQFTNALRGHISYGTAFHAPTVVQLYKTKWGSNNPDLKPEESRNSEAGLTWEQGAHQASATYYRNRVKNLFGYDPLTYKEININKALQEGVTLGYAGQFGAWRLRAAYDWLNAIDKSHHDERLIRRARNSGSVALSHTWNQLETGVEVIAVGRRRDSVYDPSTYAASDDDLGGYTLTNLTARYALTREVSLEGRLSNLFDKKYELARGYNTDGFNAFVGVRYTPSR